MPASRVTSAVNRPKTSETTIEKKVKYEANIGKSKAILCIIDEES